jgi:predicted nucleotidyltransferase
MTDLRTLAATVAAELSSRHDVIAVMLHGSVARGDATTSSDVDLVVVVVEDPPGSAMKRYIRDGILIECISRSETAWRDRLRRPMPRWLWALLESQILYDEGDVAARLLQDAQEARRAYRTPQATLDEMAAAFWHGQSKVDRAVSRADALLRGYQAAVSVDWVIDALYALHDVPLPAASRRLHHLEEVPLDAVVRRDWELLLTGNVDERIAACARLQAAIRQRLPEPQLHRV